MDPRADALSARAAIARAWLGAESPVSPVQLGEVTLRPHQAAGVARVRAALQEYGGALLADETGLGKTYIAVALIAEAQRPLVVAPSGLLPMWREALAEARVAARLHSTEALSHGRLPPLDGADLIVVDEAHHFRNPHTRRYTELARLAIGTRVLLLSATPVHNAQADIGALLALFRADAPVGRVIVRREHTADTRPRVTPIQWLETADDEATLQGILALPPPVPPRDGDAAAELVAHGLVRQWASSAGALRGALRRRLERAVAMASSLAHDRHPSYRDLREWCLGEGAVQLAFPELLISEESPEPQPLRDAVEAHAQGIRRLLAEMASRPDPDIGRASALREIIARHAGSKVLAFSAYDDTVHVLARQLIHDARVCALGSRGGTVAGGRLPRAAAIARFAPDAPAIHGIDVLIATDLLSEGLNLQEASVVVHLDLPWTPARMEQRVGRAARVGSSHSCVSVYAMAPPAASETILGVEQRLREKLRHAARALGLGLGVLPQSLDGGVRPTLERWATAEASDASVGAVRAPGGFLAAVRIGAETTLIADVGSGATDDADVVARAVRRGDNEAVAADAVAVAGAEQAMRTWAERRLAANDIGAASARDLAQRIAGIVRRTRAHRRPAVAAMAARARRAAGVSFGVGAQRALGALVEADLPDEAWLAAVAAFADAHGRPPPQPSSPGIEILAMLLFQQ